MVTGVAPSSPRFSPSIFIVHKVQQSQRCSSIFHRVLLTHALALSASQFVRKRKSQRIYTSMHSAGLKLTKLTYTRLEDSLIRHRGDRILYKPVRNVWPKKCNPYRGMARLRTVPTYRPREVAGVAGIGDASEVEVVLR